MKNYRNKSLKDLHGEIWKPVIGWRKLYMVSGHGRVKSLARKGRLKDRIMSQILQLSNGYLYVGLSDKATGRKQTSRVHVLMLDAWTGRRVPKKDKYFVVSNHLDGVKTNNFIDNLKRTTQNKNVQHAIALGLYQDSRNKRGKRRSRFSPEDVRFIRLAKYEEVPLLAKRFKCTTHRICEVRARRVYGKVI